MQRLTACGNLASRQPCMLRRRYRKLLLGVDLTKSFYFSYTYSLAHSLQHNHTRAAGSSGSSSDAAEDAGAAAAGAADGALGAAAGWDVYDASMFVWNGHLTRPLRGSINSARWTLPLVHGYWEQRQVRRAAPPAGCAVCCCMHEGMPCARLLSH